MADTQPIARPQGDEALASRVLVHYSRTGSIPATARIVNLSVNQIRYIVTSPPFQAALKSKIETELRGDAAVSRRLLRKMVLDRSETSANRKDAAKILLSLAGFVAPKAAEQAKTASSPGEMTSDQLRRQVDEIERELSQRAEPVHVNDVQLTDMLG